MLIPRYDPRDELEPIDVEQALQGVRALLDHALNDPAAARYTVDQCQQAIARLEAHKALRERAQSVRFARLMNDPAIVLADAEHWPEADDLNYATDLMANAYRTWLLERARMAGGDWKRAAGWRPEYGAPREEETHARALLWLLHHLRVPMPIGKACPELQDGMPGAPARELMPFEDNVHAALVITIPVGNTSIAVFFLARTEELDIIHEGDWQPIPDIWMVDGKGVRSDPSYIRGFGDIRRQAQLWWKSVAGLPVNPGRPKGNRDRRPRPTIDALIAYKKAGHPNPPSLEEFLEHLLPDLAPSARRTTWRRLSKDWEVSWTELRRAVYGNKRRPRRHIDRG